VHTVLKSKRGGDKIMYEYDKTKTLSNSTRRQLVNMLVANMIEVHGGTGYLAWRLKTVQRNTFIGEKGRPVLPETSSGPLSEREPFSTTEQLTGDECREEISVMKHSSDENVVKGKMKATFQYRQSMVRNPEKSRDVLGLFPRFLDTPGLTGTSIPLFLEKFGAAQPFLLCVGENRKSIQRYFVIVDMKAIPCKAQTSVGAFDELFKAHFALGTSYSESLSSFYIFIQTAIYNTDAGTSEERPRVREMRARFLCGKN
ncbi:hypothetical protein IRJ41_015721, partial [Triplophysa rosa]